MSGVEAAADPGRHLPQPRAVGGGRAAAQLRPQEAAARLRPGLITSQPFIAHWQIIEMSNIACVNSAAQAPKD